MKVVIIEDEAVSARRMQRLLEARDMEIAALLDSNKSLCKFLDSSVEVELFFMDIHLSDGVVFDTLSKYKLNAPIIFTTAYDQYAIKAFKQNSIDYLLKPIDEAELDAAILKYKNSKQQSFDLNLLSTMLKTSSVANSYKDRITVRVGEKLRRFDMMEVKLFYSSNKTNYILTSDGRSYPIDYTIEEISHQLSPKNFYRINRGMIVSIHAIKDVAVHSNSRLKVLIDKAPEDIIVSRDRVKAFKDWLG